MYSNRYVKEDLEQQKLRREKCLRLLEGLPAGKLSAGKANGKMYYKKREGGRLYYLGDESKWEVQGMKKRYFLEKMIKECDKNIAMMENYIKNYRSTDTTSIMKLLPVAYQLNAMVDFEDAKYTDFKKWEKGGYRRSAYHEELLKHRTQKGDYVRSKSEVIIANILYSRGIPYHYEELFELDGAVHAPDFKIAVVSENRFKFLEHCGMIGDEYYRKKLIWRFQTYLKSGFIPWRDVFFTFDDMDGTIDTVAINKLIDHYFI